MQTVVSVFGVQPLRIGGTETFARELSLQLGQRGWKSVLCFDSKPGEEVARFLDLPNVSLEVLEDSTGFNLKGTSDPPHTPFGAASQGAVNPYYPSLTLARCLRAVG